MNSYSEKIEGLKRELETHVANLRSATDWVDFVRLYRALCTIEELADAPKTSLEELMGVTPDLSEEPRRDACKKSDMGLGDQVESEPATEMEKGS